MISVVIPIFNEEGNIDNLYDKVVSSMEALGRPWEVILVNDGSTDDSFNKLLAVASNDSRIKVVNFRKNFGQTAAMMAGIDYASGEIIVPMDGDLQNDPDDIKKLIEKIEEGYDVVSGWRKNRKDNKLKRNLPSKIANKLISYISGVKLNDYGCSLKAYKKDVIKGVRLYGEMHRFIPIYASWRGGKVTEVVVNHYPRVSGVSKYGLNRIFKVILDLCVVKFLDKYATKPIYVFGGVGLVSILLSFTSLILALVLKFFNSVSLILTPLPLLSAFLFMTGVVSILMGLLAELGTRTYFESQGKDVYLVKSLINLD